MTVKPMEDEESSKSAADENSKREHVAADDKYGESTEEEVEGFKIHWRCPVVHHQVLKIREEESHLGEDIGEAGLSVKDKSSSSSSSSSSAFLHLRSQMDALFYSRPMLPSSPLGNKSVIRSLQ